MSDQPSDPYAGVVPDQAPTEQPATPPAPAEQPAEQPAAQVPADNSPKAPEPVGPVVDAPSHLVTWEGEDGVSRYGLRVATEDHDGGKIVRVIEVGQPVGVDAELVEDVKP